MKTMSPFDFRFRHPSRLQEIIQATQANSYHGFLPALVRQCIDKLTGKLIFFRNKILNNKSFLLLFFLQTIAMNDFRNHYRLHYFHFSII